MASKEYYEGRDMEKNSVLHSYLKKTHGYDSVKSDGKNSTKGDIIAEKNGEKISHSLKCVSGKNTQVHLTTIKKLSSDLNIPNDVNSSLVVWLGSNDDVEFNSWSNIYQMFCFILIPVFAIIQTVPIFFIVTVHKIVD